MEERALAEARDQTFDMTDREVDVAERHRAAALEPREMLDMEPHLGRVPAQVPEQPRQEDELPDVAQVDVEDAVTGRRIEILFRRQRIAKRTQRFGQRAAQFFAVPG